MASQGHHKNGLSEEPVKNQAAAEDEAGNDSNSVPTAHQEEANNQEIDHRFFESELNFCFSTTARWRQRFACAKGLAESCEDLSLRGKEEILQELDKVFSCSKAECENKLCVSQNEFRTLIEAFYAGSSSSVTGEEVGPQVEGGSQVDNGLQLEVGPQDSAELIALKNAIAALQAEKASLASVAAMRVSTAATKIRTAAQKIIIEAMLISYAHGDVKSALWGVSRGSNETHFTMGTLRSKQQEQASAESLDATRFGSPRAPSPDAVDEVLQNCASITNEETPNVDGKNTHVLRDFVGFLQKLLNDSKVPSDDYESDQYSNHIQETVREIVDWKTGTNESVPALYKPSWKGHETRGAHPILCAIMWKIAYMYDDNGHFFREQIVPKEGTRSPRFVDMGISDVVEFVKETIPALLDVPLVVKPTALKKVLLHKMLAEGESQMIGHLAKILLEAFHLGGIGVDCSLRGVVMTMVSVELVEMELSGMGTAKVKLEMRKTGHLPLFDMDTTLNLLGDMEEKSCIVKKCLKQFTEGDSPQEGFILLQKLLSGKLEHREPTSPTYSNRTGDTSIQLGRLLGSGAFSSVYAFKEDGETFLKTPKSRPCVQVLKDEAEALKALDHVCIPKVFVEDAPHLGILTVKLLCEKSKLPSLRLKGLIGSPALQVNVKGLNEGDLQRIVGDVTSALKHAHARGWIHLDVRPSNIIVGRSGNDITHVQLNDFGCAARKETELTHFRGCPPFAHGDLFYPGLQKWQPDDKHDMASLAFTIASLLAGSIPWFEFNGGTVGPETLKERSDMATELLRENDNKLDETTRTFLIDSINGSSVGLQKRMLAAPEDPEVGKKRKYGTA